MKKIFPYYKGVCISNPENPLGYTTKANARKRMKYNSVMPDFLATLPENYWHNYWYTYRNKEMTKYDKMEERLTGGKTIQIVPYDVRKRVYFNDIENEEVRNCFIEMEKLYGNIPFWERPEEDNERICELALQINRLGYYPHLWKDEKDYKKRLAKFVADNVEFKEQEVEIQVK